MSKHVERIKEGIATIVVLAFCGVILAAIRALLIRVVIPLTARFSTELKLLLFGALVLIVSSYVIGYIIRDLPDDVRGWMGDE